MLIGEVIDALRSAASDQWSDTKFTLITGDKTPAQHGRGYYADWSNNELKKEICSTYLQGMGIESAVHVNPVNEMPHSRVIRFSWDDGAISTIRFDHGVGCWSIDGRANDWYDNDSSAEGQVEKMYQALKNLKVKYSKRHPTQIFVKNRQS